MATNRTTSSFEHLRGRQWTLGSLEEPPEQIEAPRSRDWFAVTAFPLFAGTLGPIASALSLCSLVQPWKTAKLHPDATFSLGAIRRDFADPKWIIGVNAVSLLFGVAANIAMFLVVNDGPVLLKRYRHFFLASTIVGEVLASSILIGILIAAQMVPWIPNHASTNEYIFTAAFWFGILSAGLYAITSGFSIYTYYMLRANTRLGREGNEIQLARGHHRLMILTILLLGYIMSGAALFAHIENWPYLDAVYWAHVTILTIGFGDMHPTTHLGRSLVIPWSLGGIIILFLTIYCITKLVLEQGTSPLEVHLRDKHRLKKIHQLKMARQGGKERQAKSRFGHLWPAKARANNEKSDVLAHKPAVPPVDTLESRSEVVQQCNERKVRREAFNHMQDVLVISARKRLVYSTLFWGSSLLFVWLTGAMVFYFSERARQWSYFKSLYFAYIALSGIGYGDESVQSPAGMAFFCLWALIIVAMVIIVTKMMVDAAASPYLLLMKGFRKSISRHFGRGKDKQQVEKDMAADNELRRFHELPHNTHDKTHLLAETVKQVIQDHLTYQHSGERPHYTFEYWERILYIMGALDPKQPCNQQDGEDGQAIVSISSSSKTNSMDEWKDHRGMADWLHKKNPLNATETLTEWLLVTLVDKLVAETLDSRIKVGAVTEDLGKKEEEDVIGVC